MGALSIWHWLIVLAVVLLLFGSKKLPDAARGLGRSMRIFKSEIKEMQNDDKPVEDPAPQALTQAQPNPAQYAQPQGQPNAQGQDFPQAPQQPYQPQGQQGYTDPTAPYHGGQGQQGQ